jgi:hypothetical protein
MSDLPLLVVRLDPNQWNIVLAGLDELPRKHSGPVFATVIEQLQAQTPHQASNGVDHIAEVQNE